VGEKVFFFYWSIEGERRGQVKYTSRDDRKFTKCLTKEDFEMFAREYTSREKYMPS
jgi:hypothetical protein